MITARSRTAWLVTGLFLAVASCVQAQPRDSVFLDDLTWTELQGALRNGKTTIIVPIGGTEQNGPHMVLGNALVAPVIAYVPEGSLSPPTAHMRFPGTITIPESVFEATLAAAAGSFKVHGFHDIVFLGDHGGYQKSEQAVAVRLNREWSKAPVRVHAIVDYYRLASTRYPALLRERGFGDAEIGTHAGLADTSLALAVDPALVRSDRVRADPPPGAADGVYGDPRRSSAALGRLGVDVIVAETANAIRKSISAR